MATLLSSRFPGSGLLALVALLAISPVPDSPVHAGLVTSPLGGGPVFTQGFESALLCGSWSAVANPEICNGLDDDCVGGADDGDPLDCFDSNACTADTCDEGVGSCAFLPYDNDNDPEHCGPTCLPCPEPTLQQVHVLRSCASGSCGLVCAPGYWDVDLDLDNGCEVACASDPATTPDLPDDLFLDENCDGIDGTAADGIFVAVDGSDSDPGTREAPVATIGNGLAEAQLQNKPFLFTSTGNYGEQVSVVAGIGIHGGYERAADWARSGSRATIAGPATGALTATGIATETIVEFLEVRSADATIAGTSSHALVVASSPGLRPRHLTLVPGNGAGGLQGASAGQAGDDGGTGTVGANGFEDDSYVFCEGNVPDPPPTYAGGSACVSALNQGGNGRRGCITNGVNCAGTSGEAGSGAGGGDPGTGNSGAAGGDGEPGVPGAQGTDGAGGGGGSITGLQWVPNSGSSGATGNPGGGGGGGAGGGSRHATGTCNDWGGGGGGGGGGGCGGTAGSGGQGGGGSIGILLIDSALVAEEVDVSAGAGGTGGAGRTGGASGPAGLGESGGSGYDESYSGGGGGNGGAGGRGGHGGGGAGGWSVCVYRANSSYTDGGSGVLVPGTGGLGGESAGNYGVAGSAHTLYP